MFPTRLQAGGQARVIYSPPAALAGKPNLTAHVGFDYWSPDTKGQDAVDLPMKSDGKGGYEVVVPLRSGARLLDLAFFSTDSSGQTWDNNGKQDYHRSIGVPLLGPYLTFRDNLGGQADRDPARSMRVSFRSDHPCLGRVRYGTSGSPLSSSVTGPVPRNTHHLVLANLTPDTVYDYRVECEDLACALPDPSPTYSFRTAKTVDDTFTFVHIGDAQYDRAPANTWKTAVAELQKPPLSDARFFVFAGDLTADDSPVRWWDFFDVGRALFASKPLLPSPGNHDANSTNTETFKKLFSPESSSGQEDIFGVIYGSAAFLMLSSETSKSLPTDWQLGGAQHTWVKNALAKLTAPWRFAVWHIPPYNAGTRHAAEVDAVLPMTSLFNDAVDWVLCGHEHLAQRFQPLRYAGLSGGKVQHTVASTYGAGGGVGYLVNPAVGQDPNDTLVPASHAHRKLLAYPTGTAVVGDNVGKWNGLIRIDLTKTTIQIRTYKLGESTPRDTLSYTKP